ncbi:4881_t:CDS:2, partial [Paraglomus occultum]
PDLVGNNRCLGSKHCIRPSDGSRYVGADRRIFICLNAGHLTECWTILDPIAERCLQTLAKLCKIGKIVRLEGMRGAILEIQNMARNAEMRSLNVSLFDEEDTNDKEKPELLVKEEDYLNPDVQYIVDLIRFTENSERDIDIFIKRHIFSCLDNVLDSHFGEMVSRASRDRRAVAVDAQKPQRDIIWTGCLRHDLAKDLPYGREFSLCERTGSKIDNERKILSNTLKAQKTLRDMHRTLIEAISADGAGFYTSVNLADFDIPTTYSELGSVIRIARIMLQKLLNLTVCRFKLMKDRAEKEKFTVGRVIVNARLKEYRSPQKRKIVIRKDQLEYNILL